jgi:hypothetical protein
MADCRNRLGSLSRKFMMKFPIPKRGSPSCVLLLVEIIILLLPGIALTVLGIVDIVTGNFRRGAILIVVGIFIILFAFACIKETLDTGSYVTVNLAHDADQISELTPRELRLLKEVKRDIKAPSHDDVLAILRRNDVGTIVTANSKLQPIAFALRPTNIVRYVKGVVLEILTWAVVLVCAPLLLLIAAADAATAWDAGKGVLYKAMRVSRRARRYRIRPHNVFLHDDRVPILYLRAFSEEYSDRLEGFFPKTPEERLANYYQSYGPVIAVGEPEEEIPLLGASRIYFDNATWQAGILYLMSVSQLVVIHAGFAPGLLWELGVARQKVQPERLQISFVAWADIEPEKRNQHYLRFRKYVKELVDWELPEKMGNKLAVSFGPNWKAKMH